MGTPRGVSGSSVSGVVGERSTGFGVLRSGVGEGAVGSRVSRSGDGVATTGESVGTGSGVGEGTVGALVASVGEGEGAVVGNSVMVTSEVGAGDVAVSPVVA